MLSRRWIGGRDSSVNSQITFQFDISHHLYSQNYSDNFTHAVAMTVVRDIHSGNFGLFCKTKKSENPRKYSNGTCRVNFYSATQNAFPCVSNNDCV